MRFRFSALNSRTYYGRVVGLFGGGICSIVFVVSVVLQRAVRTRDAQIVVVESWRLVVGFSFYFHPGTIVNVLSPVGVRTRTWKPGRYGVFDFVLD